MSDLPKKKKKKNQKARNLCFSVSQVSNSYRTVIKLNAFVSRAGLED